MRRRGWRAALVVVVVLATNGAWRASATTTPGINESGMCAVGYSLTSDSTTEYRESMSVCTLSSGAAYIEPANHDPEWPYPYRVGTRTVGTGLYFGHQTCSRPIGSAAWGSCTGTSRTYAPGCGSIVVDPAATRGTLDFLSLTACGTVHIEVHSGLNPPRPLASGVTRAISSGTGTGCGTTFNEWAGEIHWSPIETPAGP